MRNPFKRTKPESPIMLQNTSLKLENMTLQTRLEAAEQILLQVGIEHGVNDKYVLQARRWGDRRSL